MRAQLILLVAWFALAGAAPAGAASWSGSLVEVPNLGLDATLGNSNQPALADAAGRVHLVFQYVLEDESSRLAHVIRDAEGAWGDPVILSEGDLDARDASLALDSAGRLHAVWEEIAPEGSSIRYRRRDADGTWLPGTTLFPRSGVSTQARIAVDAYQRVHVLWIDSGADHPQVLHTALETEPHWSEPRAVSVGDQSPEELVLAADGLGYVHAVWRERVGMAKTGITYDLYYLRLDSDLSESPPPMPLVSGLSISRQPNLAATEDGVVHLVWVDNRTALQGAYYEIFYKRLLPGIGWGHDKVFSYDYGEHSRPVVVPGASRSVNIAWEDYRKGNPEVYYRQITPETGWDPGATRITNDNSSSQGPALVATPGGGLLLLWTDALANGSLRILTREGSVYSAH